MNRSDVTPRDVVADDLAHTIDFDRWKLGACLAVHREQS